MGNSNSSSERAPALQNHKPSSPGAATSPSAPSAPAVLRRVSHRRVAALRLDANPFECPLCLCLFDAHDNVPTTFLCGHSVCISHVPQLRSCPFCRGRLPPIEECKPSVTLRDVSVLFAQITAEAMQCQDLPDDDDEKETGDGSGEKDVVFHSSLKHQAVSSSAPAAANVDFSDTVLISPRQQRDALVEAQRQHHAASQWTRLAVELRPLAPVLGVPNAIDREHQLALDEQFARVLQAQIDQETGIVNIRPRNGSAAAGDGAVASRADVRRDPNAAVVVSSNNCETCQRQCFLCYRWGKCCHCMDQRPQVAEGTYLRYVDGEGWTRTGTRSLGYCIRCQN